jgi:hypothetical protein
VPVGLDKLSIIEMLWYYDVFVHVEEWLRYVEIGDTVLEDVHKHV